MKYALIILAVFSLGIFWAFQQKQNSLGRVDFSSYMDHSDTKDLQEVQEFKKIVDQIDRGELQISTVKEFLEKIPNSMKDKYTLVYGSRSLQSSSLENPRAIVFSQQAEIIYSFNGDPKHNGYHQIEIMYLDSPNGKIEMKELQFSGEPGSPHLKTRVEHNPVSCVGCHTSPAKPLWDAYRFWPGVYGSEDDDLWRGNAASNDPEKKYFAQFKRRKHPRYDELKKNEALYSSEVRPNLFLTERLFEFMSSYALRDILYSPKSTPKQVSLIRKYLEKNRNVYTPTGKSKFTKDSKHLDRAYELSLAQRYNLYLNLDVKSPHYRTPEATIKEMSEEDAIDACREILLEMGDTFELDVRKWSLDMIPASLSNSEGSHSFCASLLQRLEGIMSYGEKPPSRD